MKGRRVLARTKIYKVTEKQITHNNGKTGIYEILTIYNTLNSVLIVPQDQEGKIIFIEEYFRAFDKTGLVLPGVVDKNETPKQAAIRELSEETKFFTKNIKKLGIMEVLPKYIYSQTHLFLATNLEPTNQFTHGDEIEDITLKHITIAKISSLIHKSTITDSRTLAALAFLLSNPNFLHKK